jgi:DNA repair protein RadC
MLPREKLHQKGVEAISDLELLSILIGTGIKDEDFISIARKSLKKIKSVVESQQKIQLNEITSIKGIG